MAKTEVLFFMDTEDFTNEHSMDAAKAIADLLTEEGVTGHFAVVGLVAELLRDRGRTDVIEAIRRHHVGSHSYRHTMHPTLCEDTDIADFDAAYAAIEQRETAALRLVREVFGQEPLFAVAPGNDNSFVAQYVYAENGVRMYGDCLQYHHTRNDVYFCNLMQGTYLLNVEELAFGSDGTPSAAFDAVLDAALDRMAQRRWAVFSTHPNMAYHKEFWDALNFDGCNRYPDGNYARCAERSAEEIAWYFTCFRRIIRRLREDDRFVITALPRVLERQKPRPALTVADVPAIRAHLAACCGPMTCPSLSLSDLFGAAVALLQGADSFTPGLCYGLLETTQERGTSAHLTAAGVRAAVQALPQGRFWPSRYTVDGLALGFCDMLYAMYAVLDGEDTFTLPPHPPMRALEEAPSLQKQSYYTWWLHADGMKDAYLSDRLRLQLYTLRPMD